MIYAHCRIVGCCAPQLKLARYFPQDQPKTLSLTFPRHLMPNFLSFLEGWFTCVRPCCSPLLKRFAFRNAKARGGEKTTKTTKFPICMIAVCL